MEQTKQEEILKSWKKKEKKKRKKKKKKKGLDSVKSRYQGCVYKEHYHFTVYFRHIRETSCFVYILLFYSSLFYFLVPW